MAKNSRGFLSGNTKKLRKEKKTTIGDRLKSFKPGDSVVISVKPERDGAPHLRYNGRRAKVVEVRGKGYVLELKDGGKMKQLIATALHLESV